MSDQNAIQVFEVEFFLSFSLSFSLSFFLSFYLPYVCNAGTKTCFFCIEKFGLLLLMI
jgi:hypothetical protein